MGDRSDPPEVKKFFKNLVEDFLYGFIGKKLEKVTLKMADVGHFFTPSTKKEEVLVKIMANAVKDPPPKLIEIKKPDLEALLVEKIDARLVASNESH